MSASAVGTLLWCKKRDTVVILTLQVVIPTLWVVILTRTHWLEDSTDIEPKDSWYVAVNSK